VTLRDLSKNSSTKLRGCMKMMRKAGTTNSVGGKETKMLRRIYWSLERNLERETLMVMGSFSLNLAGLSRRIRKEIQII
jgi:hypothetical protein